MAFDQDAAKELQHLLPAVSTNRTGSCGWMLDDFWSSILQHSHGVFLRSRFRNAIARVSACAKMQGAIENHRSTVAGTMLQIAERGFSNERPSFVEGRSTSSLAATAESLLKDVFNRTLGGLPRNSRRFHTSGFFLNPRHSTWLELTDPRLSSATVGLTELDVLQVGKVEGVPAWSGERRSAS